MVAKFSIEAGTYSGDWIHSSSDLTNEKSSRIDDPELANSIVDRCKGKSGIITEEKVIQEKPGPLLYDMVSLQKEFDMDVEISKKILEEAGDREILSSLGNGSDYIHYIETSFPKEEMDPILRSRFSTEATLGLAKIVQDLYAAHKVISMPFTDSNHLQEDYLVPVQDILQQLAESNHELSQYAELARASEELTQFQPCL